MDADDASCWSSEYSDNEDSDDDGDDKTTYTPPSRERMQANHHVHQPPVPKTVVLMGLRGWKTASKT